MKASLIVPVYNAEEFLEDCLRSAVKQDLPDDKYEVIAIDDGSTDGSREIIDSFAREYLPLRAIHQQNRGPARTRTRGLREARGDYIFILSHDCVAVPDWLSTVVNVFESNPKVGVVQGQILPEEEITQPIVHCTVVRQFSFSFETAEIAYRASALDKAGRYLDEELSEYGDDTDVAWRILEAGYTAKWIDRPLAYHKVLPQDFWKGVKRAWGVQKFALLIKKHPGIREYLRWGIIWSSLNRPVRLGLTTGIIITLALKKWLLAAVIVTLLATLLLRLMLNQTQNKNIGWKEKLFLIIPQHYLAGLVGEMALLSGSIRYRTLLL